MLFLVIALAIVNSFFWARFSKKSKGAQKIVPELFVTAGGVVAAYLIMLIGQTETTFEIKIFGLILGALFAQLVAHLRWYPQAFKLDWE